MSMAEPEYPGDFERDVRAKAMESPHAGGSVERELDRLANALSELEERTVKMGERLSVGLRPSNPQPEPDRSSAETAAQSVVADRIQQARFRVEAIISVVRDLTERVDL